MRSCSGPINKIYGISQYNCRMDKNEASKYKHLKKLSGNITQRKSIFW